MTIYEDLFSNIDKMAVYIHESCCGDCYCCSWPVSIPCNHKFNVASVDDIFNWLNYENSNKA